MKFAISRFLKQNDEVAYTRYLAWKTEPSFLSPQFDRFFGIGTRERDSWQCRVCAHVRELQQYPKPLKNVTKDMSCDNNLKLETE